MANCHSLFNNFNQTIRLTEQRRQALLSARNDLRERIQSAFKKIKPQLPSVHDIEFQTQGSFIMDTIINPISEDYDLDDGVYFLGNYSRSQRPEPKYFHQFILESIKNGNPFVSSVKDKDTCVRAYYKEGFSYLFENKVNNLTKGFHVDLPSYYSGTKKSPDLAHLIESWLVSDPVELIEWFEKKVKSNFKSEFLYERKMFSAQYDAWKDSIRKQDAQLRRIVRYLKAWCDYQGADMPCGIVLTILAAENYAEDQRDDVALKNTLVNIQTKLLQEFECRRPTTPKGDNLLANYKQKNHFMTKLSEFVESAKQAINEDNQKRSCAKWQIHFGHRFSCAAALDYNDNTSSYGSPAIITGNAKSA